MLSTWTATNTKTTKSSNGYAFTTDILKDGVKDHVYTQDNAPTPETVEAWIKAELERCNNIDNFDASKVPTTITIPTDSDALKTFLVQWQILKGMITAQKAGLNVDPKNQVTIVDGLMQPGYYPYITGVF